MFPKATLALRNAIAHAIFVLHHHRRRAHVKKARLAAADHVCAFQNQIWRFGRFHQYFAGGTLKADARAIHAMIVHGQFPASVVFFRTAYTRRLERARIWRTGHRKWIQAVASEPRWAVVAGRCGVPTPLAHLARSRCCC